MICLTNLFSWMAHVCYSLYFTDFVGEAVFNGDPMVSKFICLHTLKNIKEIYNQRLPQTRNRTNYTKKEFALVAGVSPCIHFHALAIL